MINDRLFTLGEMGYGRFRLTGETHGEARLRLWRPGHKEPAIDVTAPFADGAFIMAVEAAKKKAVATKGE